MSFKGRSPVSYPLTDDQRKTGYAGYVPRCVGGKRRERRRAMKKGRKEEEGKKGERWRNKEEEEKDKKEEKKREIEMKIGRKKKIPLFSLKFFSFLFSLLNLCNVSFWYLSLHLSHPSSLLSSLSQFLSLPLPLSAFNQYGVAFPLATERAQSEFQGLQATQTAILTKRVDLP